MSARYTQEQVEKLKGNSSIETVCENTFTLTGAAYRLLYEVWRKDKDVSALRKELDRMGLWDTLMNDEYLSVLLWDFRRNNGYMPHINSMDGLSINTWPD